MERYTHGAADKWTHRLTDRWKVEWTNGKIDIWTDRQKDGANGQIEKKQKVIRQEKVRQGRSLCHILRLVSEPKYFLMFLRLSA